MSLISGNGADIMVSLNTSRSHSTVDSAASEFSPPIVPQSFMMSATGSHFCLEVSPL